MHLNIVCPFCERKHPVPLDFDDVYSCACGARYRICSSDLLDDDIDFMAKSVMPSDLLFLSAEEEMGFCQVVVNREFDRIISLKQSVDETSEMRFCKYNPTAELALVWMKRPY